ncbi:fasciclin domain-containing protein [Millisia brevis]|uniref:fasciclin domain-containing protein n=1 Tax=Millisia brevis TaxID=264148 RepID=UPI00082E7CBA|nr:fasciclin domain-containing protein [Millisia brevis]
MGINRRSIAIIGIGALSLGMAACSSNDSTTADTTAAETSVVEETTTMATTTEEAVAAGPLGPGCAAYVEQVPSGPGSVEELANGSLVEAVTTVPILTTLASAVSGGLNPEVNLVEALEGGPFTVFAPVDDAFAALDPATLEALAADPTALTQVLTYHVVEGEAAPGEIAGVHPTLEGSEVTVAGAPDALTVNDANVICGGIETTNATVYLVDGVLTPAQ